MSDITATSSTNRIYQSVDGGEMKLFMTLRYKKVTPARKPGR